MTHEETAKLLKIVKINFRSAFRDLNKEEAELIIEQWAMNFKPFSWQEVLTAFNDYMKSNAVDFAPQVGQIHSGIIRILEKRMVLPQMSFAEAWEKIFKSARCNPRLAKEEFATLPENIQKALGGYGVLVDLGNSNLQEAGWIKKRLEKEYNEILAEEKLMLMDGRITLDTVKKSNALPMYEKNGIELKYDSKNF